MGNGALYMEDEVRKKKQEKCGHGYAIYEGVFYHQGLRRHGVYCKYCHLLLDYYPQFNEDDLK